MRVSSYFPALPLFFMCYRIDFGNTKLKIINCWVHKRMSIMQFSNDFLFLQTGAFCVIADNLIKGEVYNSYIQVFISIFYLLSPEFVISLLYTHNFFSPTLQSLTCPNSKNCRNTWLLVDILNYVVNENSNIKYFSLQAVYDSSSPR